MYPSGTGGAGLSFKWGVPLGKGPPFIHVARANRIAAAPRGITVKGLSERGWWIYSACSVDARRNAVSQDLRARARISPRLVIPSAAC